MNLSNLLEILEIPKDTKLNKDNIKSAYRKLAKKYHPDVFSTAEGQTRATVIFKKITEAYEYLLVHYKEYNYKEEHTTYKETRSSKRDTRVSPAEDKYEVDIAKKKKRFAEFETLYNTVFQDFMI